MKTNRERLNRLIRHQEYRLKQALDAWRSYVTKIRDNPNRLDVRSVGLGDFLARMEKIRVLVVEREQQLAETKELIAEPETFQ